MLVRRRAKQSGLLALASPCFIWLVHVRSAARSLVEDILGEKTGQEVGILRIWWDGMMANVFQ